MAECGYQTLLEGHHVEFHVVLYSGQGTQSLSRILDGVAQQGAHTELVL